MKIKFPKTPNKINYIYRSNPVTDVDEQFVAISIAQDHIIFYIWDGFSKSWNKSLIFEREK